MLLNSAQRNSLAREANCELRFDDLTRQLYATDASIYQVVPAGVAFPASAAEAASVIRAAIEHDVPVTPRGAGTGLAGAALGEGLVVDFARKNRRIIEFDPESRTVRVEPGVVLDPLNAFLKPHGLCFGPDVATSSRATLGGMIANNSSGARAPIYGTTADHVESLDLVLTDGRRTTIDADHAASELHRTVQQWIEEHRASILERCPEGLIKRWPGYGFERWLRRAPGIASLIAGSEGTLAAVVSAKLRLVPSPASKSLGVIFFGSVTEAMTATVDLLDLGPAAIEHIDDVLLDQTRGKLAFKRARALLRLDEAPCKAVLLVEFFDDDGGRLRALMDRRLGLRCEAFAEDADMEAVWALRKAGLALLTGRPGPAKPTTGIEDAAVPPRRLPDYVNSLQAIMGSLGLSASFYGHAASGLLHVRPVVDLHQADDIAKFRRLAEETSALVKQFKGSIAAEHGVGIARTEFMPDHLGPELLELHRRVKALFDPKGLMNPGKIIPDGRFRFDRDLRWGAGYEVPLPFGPILAFAAKDKCFAGNLEQCNGSGACLKLSPTMCPTYLATGEEIMSTRGRANTIRAVLDGRLKRDSDFYTKDLDAALSNCVGCKACATECPSNVNMPLLKAELLHARHQRRGLPLRERIFSRVDLLGELGAGMPALANAALQSRPVRVIMQRVLGISSRRPLPPYAEERFDTWFQWRRRGAGERGKVFLWDDCFVRYHEPHIGKAAVRVLEAAGYAVELVKRRACCGRPAFSAGRLDLAADFARHNVETLSRTAPDAPIVFLEPSCYSMLVDDYRELKTARAENIAERCYLFEEFIGKLMGADGACLPLQDRPTNVAVHIHCHAKALVDVGALVAALRHLPGANVTRLDTGCCGMAGAFGAMVEKYDLSVAIAWPLVQKLDALPDDTTLIASGTSCRHQIEHLTHRRPLHAAELLAGALAVRSQTHAAR